MGTETSYNIKKGDEGRNHLRSESKKQSEKERIQEENSSIR
jgi:hypothetical protein